MKSLVGGKEVQEGGDICVHVADSPHHIVETNQLCWCVSHSLMSDSIRDPMDCSPPGSSVHRLFQARLLEWVAMPFSRGSS